MTPVMVSGRSVTSFVTRSLSSCGIASKCSGRRIGVRKSRSRSQSRGSLATDLRRPCLNSLVRGTAPGRRTSCASHARRSSSCRRWWPVRPRTGVHGFAAVLFISGPCPLRTSPHFDLRRLQKAVGPSYRPRSARHRAMSRRCHQRDSSMRSRSRNASRRFPPAFARRIS